MAGNNNDARIAITTITASSSINVNPAPRVLEGSRRGRLSARLAEKNAAFIAWNSRKDYPRFQRAQNRQNHRSARLWNRGRRFPPNRADNSDYPKESAFYNGIGTIVPKGPPPWSSHPRKDRPGDQT